MPITTKTQWPSFFNGASWRTSGQESACRCRRCRFDPWVRKIPWRRKWLPTPVFLPGESHGQRSLVGYSPWGHKESDMTEQLTHTHTHRHTHTHTHTLWSRNPTPGYLFKRNDNLSRAEVAQKTCIGLPCWLGGEESTCQCRRHRFDSWSRRTPHAVKQLSPCATTTEPGLESQEATTTEPMCLDRVCALQPEKPPQRETHSLQPEKGLCSNKDPMQPKINT